MFAVSLSASISSHRQSVHSILFTFFVAQGNPESSSPAIATTILVVVYLHVVTVSKVSGDRKQRELLMTVRVATPSAYINRSYPPV